MTAIWDEGGLPMASVEAGGEERTACLAYVPEVRVGEDVLVHLGFAVQRLEAQQAADAIRLRSGRAD